MVWCEVKESVKADPSSGGVLPSVFVSVSVYCVGGVCVCVVCECECMWCVCVVCV